MSDHEQLDSIVKKQNCNIRATSNPRSIHQRQFHPLKRTVWYVVSSQTVIGLYFFENEVVITVTINNAEYPTKLEVF